MRTEAFRDWLLQVDVLTPAQRQHGVEVLRQEQSPPAPWSPALARRTRQVALSLVRVQEIGFIRFHDALQARRLDLGREGEKPVAPAEGGVLVKATAVGGPAHGVAVKEGLGVLTPALPMPQMRQRRLGERVEGLAAGGAAIPR